MHFRHEWKHLIGPADLLALRARLSAVMLRDHHAADGSYQVRSLYFDNLADKALREKIDSVNCREKSASATTARTFRGSSWKRKAKSTGCAANRKHA